MELSNLAFAIVSNGRKPAKTTEPQLTVTSTKGKLKFNEALSRLLSIQHGDHATLINNEAAVIASGEEGLEVTWGIVKGYPDVDADGVVKIGRNRVTGDEEDKFVGFKLASNGKAEGIGVSLEGSDSANYVALGGNPDTSIVFSIEVEPTIIEIAGEERTAFIMGESKVVDKLKRGTAGQDVDVDEDEDQ